ncbi:unnamed protein product [Heligmosomoides polygyrus]|uniref:TFIIS N-terminal domain-containing protein n=1 Tax=Heligmosomoides polygyrus TaxID=6339 RepID=A0A183FMI2_HELPZ|nr:unnamed protein product [Heligmosomoides polygyrus]
MAVDDALLSKVTKYGKLIKKKEKIPHVLSRLNEVEMTLDILSATNIGRYVNRLCDDPQYGREASKIIEKWKEVARQSGVRGGEEDASSEGEEAHQQRKSSPPKRVGLLNGVKEVKARSRDDDLDLEDSVRNDYHREDSEMRYREKYSSKNDRKRAHYGSDEESYKISRHSAHRDDVDRRRRHDDDAEERGDGDRHRHRSHHGDDGRKKKRDVEVEPTKKRKPREDRNQRWADSDEDHHSDSFQSGSNPVHERSAAAMHCQDSKDHHKSSGEITSSSDNDDMESVRSCEKEASPIRRESSGKTSKKDSPDRREHSSHATHKSSSSSTKLSKSGSKSKERNPPKVVTDFDMMLQSADSSQPKSRKNRDSQKIWAEVPILTNYQPFPQAFRVKEPPPPPVDDFNPENMFKPRNERGKVFAGRRKTGTTGLPSLYNLCLRVLSSHTKVLYYAEYINYDVLKPILEKCNAEDLAHIESKHQYLEEDSSELWQRFVTKKYPGEEPDNGDSWKDLYYFLEKEKEKKLKQLSLRIGKNHLADTSRGHRKAILADASAPANVRRRQIQHGTGHVSRPLPSAIEVSSARRKIFETGGCKDALAALPQAVVNKNSMVGAKLDRGGPKKTPAKKGALMIKTMKMLNMKRK